MPLARASAVPFALIAAVLAGCGTANTATPAATAPAMPPIAPEGPSAAPPSAEPPIATEDGWVQVPRPRGAGWDCVARRVDDARVQIHASFVQCRRPTPAGVESLMAKDYQVPPSAVMSAEELSTKEYPNHYRKRWNHVTYRRSGRVDHRGQAGWEVAIDLTQEGGPTTHLVERVIVVGTHTLNLSADGPAETFGALEPEMRRWFEGARFATLRGDPRHEARREGSGAL